MLLPYLYCKYTNKRARNKKLASLFFTESESIGNNIDVDPTFKCHAERSRSIYLKRGLRSNAFSDVADAHCEIKTSFISLAQSQHSHPVSSLRSLKAAIKREQRKFTCFAER